jgi:hypothetical protein
MRVIDYQTAAGMLNLNGWYPASSWTVGKMVVEIVWEKPGPLDSSETMTLRRRVIGSPNDEVGMAFERDCQAHNWLAMKLTGVEEFVDFAAAMELCS